MRTQAGGVALRVENGLDVRVHLTVSGFGGRFFQAQEVGAGGVTMVLNNAHWDVWHDEIIDVALAYRFGDATLSGKPYKIGPKMLFVDDIVQVEAVENDTSDTPTKDKSHGKPPANTNLRPDPKGNQPVDPKGHQGTGINDKKPKTVGGGPACPGGCRSGTWRQECRPICT
ncbi:hypothetical protein EG328_007257 [Venturia inaequalis]|uniref:Uncharacterized protein n=2 Tax=Venturia inaequalis TaxID=5025 RepID=A0A8H3UET5_VENIN|nr:hypothetical protein EG328_007257 [Venturia inaequalis]RDI77727.1 hypothetical protein Vi05172_g12287 [Venturia inaequalis]